MIDHKDFGTRCEICFETLDPALCAVDMRGDKWDVCRFYCAVEAGVPMRRQITIMFRSS